MTRARRASASIAYVVISSNASKIATVLGGEPTVYSMVPSKKAEVTYTSQPLRRKPLARRAPRAQAPTYTELPNWPARWSEDMQQLGILSRHDPVVDERVLLIEATWVTGATAINAAGRYCARARHA